jgi:geranyl-CoA carboxylase beta subunit
VNPFVSRLDSSAASFAVNREYMLALLGQLRRLEQTTRDVSARAGPRFTKLGKLLPRQRLERVLDPGAPLVELSTLAGFCQDEIDGVATSAETSVAGGGLLCVIGYVSGVRCMVVVDDAGIEAGAMQAGGVEKFQRAQAIALENKLPFVHLVESAGANLPRYRVQQFIHGGKNFYNLARLSAAGIPVLSVVHGASTAGGAYMTGLADIVVMVRGRAKAFLAGPALLQAATGEKAEEDALGGAEMHASVSGTAEYLAEDDAHALGIARAVLASLPWREQNLPLPVGPPPRYSAEDLLGIMPADGKKPVDMREVIARIVDDSAMLEFKADYGPATVCVHAHLCGLPVGVITNNGPLDPAGANKATHFIQLACQTGLPLLYLQNTTGYMVGVASEQAGMIKIGSKMIQAVANAQVPQLTVMCGASYGAGNYGMCGRAFGPRFVFSWPNARTAVMGAEQAALTMRYVAEESARRRGQAIDEADLTRRGEIIVANFERQQSAFYTSGLLLDDAVIDPRDSRQVLAFALSVCAEASRRELRPLDFGVARP